MPASDFDITRLIPAHFLRTKAGKELAEALNAWLDPIWADIQNIRLLLDPDSPISEEFLADTFNNIGFPRDLILDYKKGVSLFKITPDIWSQQSSKKFYEAIAYLTDSSINYRHLGDEVMSYSNNTAWSSKRYQDADFYREGAFSTNVSVSDLDLVQDILSTFFTAGYFIYYLLSFGVEGARKHWLGDIAFGTNIKSLARTNKIPHSNITVNIKTTATRHQRDAGFSIISGTTGTLGIIFDTERWNIQNFN